MVRGGKPSAVSKRATPYQNLGDPDSYGCSSPHPHKGEAENSSSPRAVHKGRFPLLRPIKSLPTQHLRRFMFGFRLKAKHEHEATQVLSW